MEEIEKNRIQEKLTELRNQATNQQWRRVTYIQELAIDFEDSDLRLAYRLMQRAKNLAPDDVNIKKKLKAYRTQLKKLNQELVVSSIDHRSASLASSNVIGKPQDEVAQSTVESGTSQSAKSASGELDIGDVRETKKVLDFIKKPIFVFAILPWLFFLVYQLFIMSPRFESQAQIIVQQPDAATTLDPAMAMLSGLGVPTTNTDTELVKAYIYSQDMIGYLDETIDLQNHWKSTEADFFSRLRSDSTQEDFRDFYLKHVLVEIDDASSVVTIKVQAFDSNYALDLNNTIVDRAEWYINEIGHQLAKEQLKFVQSEHQLVEQKLRKAQSSLLNFQQQHNLLDPEAEGMAVQQITYGMESALANKQAELKALLNVMNENAPQVLSLKNEISALRDQLLNQRDKLSDSDNQVMTLSQVLAKFTDYKIDMDIALKSYASSLISLEKSRVEAYRQLKYLVVVETPTKPESHTYPLVLYNITLFGVIALMLFGIVKIVRTTIHELN